ncbi:Radical SAM domain protein [uncultured spirochete]|jgi:MoaA/NifB/PqqE/SkfB family radical SAM enzyme|uniref:Radical SAM domain protein n=1 Tax=uncultured spirochete TaxID=156406 RepID=A0A3P3XS37_9SPIR|nr:Radical SAM domain protein [uncultured spirochete]
MSLKARIAKSIVMSKIKYIREDPDTRLPEILDSARKIDRTGRFDSAFDTLEPIAKDRNNNWNRMVRSLLAETDPVCLEKLIGNLAINTELSSLHIRERAMKKYGCNIPWAILMDPTAACNLHCIGCWASEYQKTANMDFDLLDRIITEGKKLGIYMYIYSGGEPLVRKADLFRLAQKHSDCYFLAFSNATMVDEAFAEESARVGNFALAISIEGFEEETDMRRGKGTYAKVIAAMDILKARGIPFGFSACYHRYNTDVVGSESFVDFMVEKGARFGWYFTYMPLGRDAKTDLLATPDQREYMYRKVREYRETKPIFVLDFWNDGEYVKGCIAGGKSYLHINAAGDVEPCAFIHYSNANIHNMSLIDTLRQPLFREYAAGQPFNENHVRPCPLLDNPEKLRGMVERSGAHSTQLLDEEDVVSLTAKCEDAANNWSARADTLWKERNEEKARQEAERAARNAARQGAKNKKTEEEIYQP